MQKGNAMQRNNYVRLMRAGGTKEIICFDSTDPIDVRRARAAVERHGKSEAVIWSRIEAFVDLREVGESSWRPAQPIGEA
jgi:hypothetical protein